MKFLQNTYKNLIQEEKEKCLFIFDNASFHKRDEIIQFCLKKNIRVLTICPYNSKLDMAELYFRNIKLYTYQETFQNLTELHNKITDVIKRTDEILILKWFNQTLKVYEKFLNENLSFNLNTLLQ